ncbi:biofilm PGA synthesis N-glycosyltransferase PgaC [Streptacidiphilus sp. BW17]|uniref:glycosyltransferase n=1 Tax=Streptacidiphilus sp. BW17 TaxID=3156274 RepID=UPI003511F3AA
MSRFGPTRGQTRKEARGPAFVRQPRNLTREGRTKPGHIPDLRYAGPGRIVVLVPAHNEEALIAETLESLAAQTRPPDEVIVVADRCTDQTARISSAHGAKAIETVGNTQDKAGALNQVLDRLLPQLSDHDAVMVMDSDTSLSPQFIAEAARRLRHQEPDQSPIGGVGAIFFGYPLRGLVCHLQNNEYVRYARELHRRHGRADVLTGTASLYPVHALRHVHQARAHGSLPRGRDVYDVESLTEDNELTLALKHLGYRCVSPCAGIVGTELMPTWSRLYYQRLRWQRGALDNLKAYGTTRVTLPYICRQLLTYLSVAFVPFFLTVLLYNTVTKGFPGWPWFWLGITSIAAFERIWAAKRGGWKALLLAVMIVPEVLFDQFLNVIYAKTLIDILTGTGATWERTHSRTRRLRAAATTTAGFTLLLAAVVGLALACIALGIAWTLIAAFVLCGVAAATIRLSRLHPLGLLLSLPSGEQPHGEIPPWRQ